jgi:hypothetical protein
MYSSIRIRSYEHLCTNPTRQTIAKLSFTAEFSKLKLTKHEIINKVFVNLRDG